MDKKGYKKKWKKGYKHKKYNWTEPKSEGGCRSARYRDSRLKIAPNICPFISFAPGTIVAKNITSGKLKAHCVRCAMERKSCAK